MPNLKPCPLCGSEPELTQDWIPFIPDNKHTYEVKCTNPKCGCSITAATPVVVVAAWNRRATEIENGRREKD